MPVDCKPWRGALTTLGYGIVRAKGKQTYAHRAAYCEANGVALADIAGLVVRHVCDNPPCVEPAHLLLGTQADNMRDMALRKRARKLPQRGEENGFAKLTAARVLEMRRAYVRGSAEFGTRGLAKRFGVDPSQVHHIVTRKQWAHLPQERATCP